MRYIEYVYLGSGIMIGIFLILEYHWMSTSRIYSFGLAILICSFMFFLRRRRRLKREANEQSEMQLLLSEEESIPDEYEENINTPS